jgi:hypothetical protein
MRITNRNRSETSPGSEDAGLTGLQVKELKTKAEFGDLTQITTRYRPDVGDAVCLLVRLGSTLKEAAKRLPIKDVTTIYSWRSTHPDFKEKLDAARKDAADNFIDKIQEIADTKDIPKEDVPGARLRVDSYKWLAEKANPQKYSPKSVIAADEDNPLQIIIDTGITRDEPLEADYTKIDDGKIVTNEEKRDLPNSDDGSAS